MKSPFIYQEYASDKTFFGRADELKKIFSITDVSNNLLIYSQRRFGKSSLMQEYMRLDKESLCIYVDIYEITSEKDFVTLLLRAIAKAQTGSITKVLAKMSQMFSRVTFEVVFDATSGKAKMSPVVRDISLADAMEDIFDALFKMSQSRKIVFIIDEFQQISLIKNVKIDAVLRKYMQQQKDISYIFLGSKRHTLTELFKYKAPLYEMATHLELGCIKNEDFIEYIQKHLNISDSLILYIIDTAKCETKLIQHICHILHLVHKKKEIKKDLIDEVRREIVLSKDSSFSMMYDGLSLNKKKAFKILSNRTDFYKKETLDEFNISKQALLSAFNSLFKEEIIDKKDSWFIPDRTLELWGVLKFGNKSL
ncbi:MAG: ATP-binding protein [Campylobacterota bacterium]|nr:ATP-binding protein [Campylobacterota bacterium]